jgi:hypothetical protein
MSNTPLVKTIGLRQRGDAPRERVARAQLVEEGRHGAIVAWASATVRRGA